MRILVVGGTGLIGQNIVRAAVLRGHTVTSLSRRGRPSANLTDDTTSDWASRVTWAAGSALDDQQQNVTSLVASADAVVHSVGLLFQTPAYNSVVNAASVVDAMRAVPAAVSTATSQLFGRGTGNGDALEFAPVQLEMPVTLARAMRSSPPAEGNKEKIFAYVSADVSPLMALAVNPEYVRTKRAAETALLEQDSGVRVVVARPAVVSSRTGRPLTWPLAVTARIMAAVGILPPVLTAEQVGRAVVAAIEDPAARGVLDPAALLEKLTT
ncbi:hypothetical protein BC828DRAFT_405977 [Blastocladiella britannica]|nr:hypothetical protein BC828DRAFT_405977 [Blastocladiella britannica]